MLPNNIFVLCTGRCGSTTFIKACRHITNYTAGHETLTWALGDGRLEFPPRHIEADNRLSWFLGRLDRLFGDRAIYVHLTRDREATAASFFERRDRGIMKAYETAILMHANKFPIEDPVDYCRDYVDTVTENIQLFLKDKSHKISVELENGERDFLKFWRMINAEGDLPAALSEWQTRHNASRSVSA